MTPERRSDLIAIFSDRNHPAWFEMTSAAEIDALYAEVAVALRETESLVPRGITRGDLEAASRTLTGIERERDMYRAKFEALEIARALCCDENEAALEVARKALEEIVDLAQDSISVHGSGPTARDALAKLPPRRDGA